MVLSKDLKIAICFGLIVGAIISFCNMCFADESEQVVLTDTRLGFSSVAVGSSGEFVDGSSLLSYFYVEPGFHYKIYNGSSFMSVIVSSDDVPSVGVSYDVESVLAVGDTYEFDSSTCCYLYFTQARGVTVTREPLEGMTNFIDQLAYSLTNDGIYETFLACVPLLVLGVLFGLSIFFIVRLIYGIIKIRGGF